ncbi:MAG TPA: FAD-dependent oxidoreductase [Nitrospirota bacterium]|nr:FAD-dependent oxidoreductase [Nitrospirota bacterium]
MPKYELAVVGAGLGGLAAAALVSRKNRKTIVLEPGDSAGGTIGVHKKDGFVFSPGPVLSFGFERGGALQKLNEVLGIAQHASIQSPCYQVALPDRRITIYAEQSETLEELRREFPREIDAIAKFYRDLRRQAVQVAKSRFSEYISRHRTAGGFLHGYRFSRELTAFFDVQSYYFYHRPVADISLPSLISLCDSVPFTVHGGFIKLAEQMVDVILKNGGEIHYGIPFSEIVLKKGQTAGLATPQGHLETDAVLLNTEQRRRGTVLCIGLREEVIPVSMLNDVLAITDYAHPERFFSLSFSARDDETVAPRGMRALTATFSLSTLQQPNEERMRQIEGLIPFLEKFVLSAEEFNSAPRSYDVPAGMMFKPLRTENSQTLLSRSSQRGVYMLLDEDSAPVHTVAAAQAFVERLR